MFRILYGKEENIKNIFVVDLDSEDKTNEIVSKLEKDYEIIKHMKYKDLKNLLEMKENMWYNIKLRGKIWKLQDK